MNRQARTKENLYKVFAILFWLVIWQVIAMIIDREMLLASPIAVIKALANLLTTSVFWQSLASSFRKIVLGFLTGTLFGVFIAVISYRFLLLRELFEPLIKVIKSTPVASFIIIALIWVGSANLSVLISFLMVVPVIYTNTLRGLCEIDTKLLEMSHVFRVSWLKRARYIYIPEVMPYFISAVSVGLGFCWKSGVAAEVIGLPKNSIGEALYEAKIYLMTKELFAWTIVIILISVLFERIIMALLKWIQKQLLL
ncbi:MAG: ABC transporter permease subunit [Clostridiales bacterium]|nr:ABC transporter permease subunit [Clostridiales bacterium]